MNKQELISKIEDAIYSNLSDKDCIQKVIEIIDSDSSNE